MLKFAWPFVSYVLKEVIYEYDVCGQWKLKILMK